MFHSPPSFENTQKLISSSIHPNHKPNQMVQYDLSRRRVPQKNDGSKASALFTFGSPSIVPFVAGPSLAMGLWATGVTCAWNWSPAGEWLKNLPQSQILITLLGVVMGLLLVFRTNTAYDRYYEGRKVWANTHSNIRSLARLFWAGVKAKDDQQEARKRGAMTLLAAFAVATKHHVRDEAGHMWDDLGPLLAHIPVFAEAAQCRKFNTRRKEVPVPNRQLPKPIFNGRKPHRNEHGRSANRNCFPSAKVCS
ncbi:UPF0187-domain-containing protein [Rhizoclosmatium globosum]|uniref:UPF0187-domain-containing protein n=1 Tax=Rhizoclosmatium globosum TaxID=329046 RepID=A0A1Y2CEZ1_9FUNG|nr:UPF0187-domain-containing protein [Rhizoclosmatium globosum]|eukprot:ORY45620.1 UPF0187-domain-containing protein [Rhizoclosmatium globosum]